MDEVLFSDFVYPDNCTNSLAVGSETTRPPRISNVGEQPTTPSTRRCTPSGRSSDQTVDQYPALRGGYWVGDSTDRVRSECLTRWWSTLPNRDQLRRNPVYFISPRWYFCAVCRLPPATSNLSLRCAHTHAECRVHQHQRMTSSSQSSTCQRSRQICKRTLPPL